MIFDHLDDQISNLEKKRMRWKVDIRQALYKAREKARKYYGKTENPRGLLLALGACLDPFSKLSIFKAWDDTEGSLPDSDSYLQKYRNLFVDYYNKHYRPPAESSGQNMTASRTTQVPSTGFGRRFKSATIAIGNPAPIERDECLEYIDSPPELDYQTSSNHNDCLYEPDILRFWKKNEGKYPNLARMARDILAVQGGAVGVERVFSMGRDVIPYRRNRLECNSIRATMIVKFHLREELKKDMAGQDPDWEKFHLQDEISLFDYTSTIPNEESGGYISDDNEGEKRDTSWEFVEHDGEKAFRRERGIQLPARHLCTSRPAGDLGSDNGLGENIDLLSEMELSAEEDENGEDGVEDRVEEGVEDVVEDGVEDGVKDGNVAHYANEDGELESNFAMDGDTGACNARNDGRGATECENEEEGELQTSRKRAGSALSGVVRRKSSKRK